MCIITLVSLQSYSSQSATKYHNPKTTAETQREQPDTSNNHNTRQYSFLLLSDIYLHLGQDGPFSWVEGGGADVHGSAGKQAERALSTRPGRRQRAVG